MFHWNEMLTWWLPGCKSIEKTLGITNNVIILGNINEDLLGPTAHNLKYVLLLNSFNDITSKPTRLDALLDLVIFSHHYIS